LKLKIRAFTLIECLVALLAISGSVLVISGLTHILQEQISQENQNSQKDWQIFCEQLRGEFFHAKLDKVENNFLYITTEKSLRFGLVGENFRKTDEKGLGYQPMLHGLKNVEISDETGQIVIKLNFKKGGERVFYYKFSNGK
jgi:competence protein ComGF